MSTFSRWKEERIRRHIYLDQLKNAQNLSNEVSVDEARPEEDSGTSDCFLEERQDTALERGTSIGEKNNSLSWAMVRLALLGAIAAVWFWIHAGQFGVHR